MREITFDIPGEPSLIIHAMEQTDGTILFQLDVTGGGVADIRGLFFNLADDSLVNSLSAEGADLSDQDYGNVSSFKNGNNVKGGGRSPYDVGMDFGTSGIGKGTVDSTSFVLSSTNGEDLTLDLIANIEFAARLQSVGGKGPQKISVTAPAAPDAIDDNADTLEDTPVTVDVIANDTDADGDALTIIEVGAAMNGIVEIVDNQIIYTSNEHWSGVDSFTYRVFDGDGGFDIATATIAVEAVADAPELSLSVRAGANVNEVIVDISSALVDTDGSETYILTFNDLPDGVELQGADGNQILLPTGEDSVTLVLDEGESFDFDFEVTATSTEASNGDMASTIRSVDIALDFKTTTQGVDFQAVDQSIWNSGAEWSFSDNRFLGFELSDSGTDGGFIYGSYAYDIKAGFQSDLLIEGGDINAEIPWELNFDSSFNRSTDVLTLDTSAMLKNGGYFNTDGPSLEYNLDFIFEYSASGSVGIDFPGVGNLGSVSVGPRDYSYPIVDYNSDTSGGLEYDFPYGITATLEWPNLEVSGTQDSLGVYSGDGASNNALNINLDIDDALTDILGSPVNPFDLGVDILGVAGANFELVDVDVSAGLNFLQDFLLEAGTLDAALIFEDGTSQDFTFGDELTFNSASILDADGDGDVEFEIALDLVGSTLTNDTDLGFNVGWNFDMIKGSWWYDLTVAGIGPEDSGSFGPFLDLGQDSIPVASLPVFDAVVDIDFVDQSVDIFA